MSSTDTAMGPDLDLLFHPRSIAIIGASTNPGKFGHQVVTNLVAGGFAGAIYPINPRATDIAGLRVFPALEAIPDPIDLAALVVPASEALDQVRACAARRVRALVIISSGFGESSPAGQAQQDQMVAVARGAGLRLVGPNCEGVVNIRGGLVLSFSMMFRGLRAGPISIVSQSGAYCGVLARRLHRGGAGPAKVISSGNEADLKAVDYLEYLVGDPETSVIGAHLEGIWEPRRFADRIGEIASRKPLVINKTGRTEVGRRQTASHTGALAGNDRVIDALLRQRAVVRTHHLDQMVDALLTLANQPPLTGTRVAILSSAGGMAVELSDLLTEAGFSVPPLAPVTEEALRAHVPAFGTVTNPVDFTGALIGSPAGVGECLQAVLTDPGIDAVVLVITAVRDPAFSGVVLEARQRTKKPLLVCWTAGTEVAGPALEQLVSAEMAVYESPLRAVQGLEALARHWRFRLGTDFMDPPR